jgi:hypothetical protein
MEWAISGELTWTANPKVPILGIRLEFEPFRQPLKDK